MRFHWVHKLISSIIILSLLSEQTLAAQPTVSSDGPVKKGEYQAAVTKGNALNLSNQIGKISDTFGENPRLFIIEDAHGNIDAQKNILKILEHLDRDKRIQQLLLEGGFHNRLQPERIHFFADETKNQKVHEQLTHLGEMGGPELFLYGKWLRKEAFDSFGVETPYLYARNLKRYQEVMGQNAEADQFVAIQYSQLQNELGKELNFESLKFFREWYSAMWHETDIFRLLRVLEPAAKKHLKLDLSDARNQIAWPMLTRIVELDKRQKKLNEDLASKELKALHQWITDKKDKVDKWEKILSQADVFSNKSEWPSGGIGGYFSRRGFWEGFYEAFNGHSFSFEQYPNLFLSEGARILQEELEADLFLDEIEKVRAMIFKALLQTEQEKKILDKAENLLRLKKLFKLELSRDEFMRLGEWLQKNPEKNNLIVKSAIAFYQAALKRDRVMYAELSKRSRRANAKGTAFIAGGFHTKAFSDLLRQHKMPFMVITPTIHRLDDSKIYQDAMMGRSPTVSISYARVPTWLNPASTETYLPQTILSRRRLISESVGAKSLQPRAETRTYSHSHAALKSESLLPFARAIQKINSDNSWDRYLAHLIQMEIEEWADKWLSNQKLIVPLHHHSGNFTDMFSMREDEVYARLKEIALEGSDEKLVEKIKGLFEVYQNGDGDDRLVNPEAVEKLEDILTNSENGISISDGALQIPEEIKKRIYQDIKWAVSSVLKSPKHKVKSKDIEHLLYLAKIGFDELIIRMLRRKTERFLQYRPYGWALIQEIRRGQRSSGYEFLYFNLKKTDDGFLVRIGKQKKKVSNNQEFVRFLKEVFARHAFDLEYDLIWRRDLDLGSFSVADLEDGSIRLAYEISLNEDKREYTVAILRDLFLMPHEKLLNLARAIERKRNKGGRDGWYREALYSGFENDYPGFDAKTIYEWITGHKWDDKVAKQELSESEIEKLLLLPKMIEHLASGFPVEKWEEYHPQEKISPALFERTKQALLRSEARAFLPVGYKPVSERKFSFEFTIGGLGGDQKKIEANTIAEFVDQLNQLGFPEDIFRAEKTGDSSARLYLENQPAKTISADQDPGSAAIAIHQVLSLAKSSMQNRNISFRSELRSAKKPTVSIHEQMISQVIYDRQIVFVPSHSSEYRKQLFETKLTDFMPSSPEATLIEAAMKFHGEEFDAEIAQTRLRHLKQATTIVAVDLPTIFFHDNEADPVTRVMQISLRRHAILLSKKFLQSLKIDNKDHLRFLALILDIGQSLIDQYDVMYSELSEGGKLRGLTPQALEDLYRKIDSEVNAFRPQKNKQDIFFGMFSESVLEGELSLNQKDEILRAEEKNRILASESTFNHQYGLVTKLLGDYSANPGYSPDQIKAKLEGLSKLFPNNDPSIGREDLVRGGLIKLAHEFQKLAFYYETQGSKILARKYYAQASEMMRAGQKIDQQGFLPLQIQQEIIYFLIRSGNVGSALSELKRLKELEYVPSVNREAQKYLQKFMLDTWAEQAVPDLLYKLQFLKSIQRSSKDKKDIRQLESELVKLYQEVLGYMDRQEKYQSERFEVNLLQDKRRKLEDPFIVITPETGEIFNFEWSILFRDQDKVVVSVDAYAQQRLDRYRLQSHREPVASFVFRLEKNSLGAWRGDAKAYPELVAKSYARGKKTKMIQPIQFFNPEVIETHPRMGMMLLRLGMKLAKSSGAKEFILEMGPEARQRVGLKFSAQQGKPSYRIVFEEFSLNRFANQFASLNSKYHSKKSLRSRDSRAEARVETFRGTDRRGFLPLEEGESHELASEIYKKLGGDDLFPSKDIAVKDRSYGFEFDLNADGPPRVVRLGPLQLLSIAPKSAEEVSSLYEQIQNALGESYQDRRGNILIHPISQYAQTYSFGQPAISLHAVMMLLLMLQNRDAFKNKTVLDLGAGDGLLARLALKLGAKQVLLVDNDQKELSKANELLKAEGWKFGEEYQIIRGDFSNQQAQDELRFQIERSEVVLANIGPWEHYGNANIEAIKLAATLPKAKLILNGGYLQEVSNPKVEQELQNVDRILKTHNFAPKFFESLVGADTAQALVASRSEARSNLANANLSSRELIFWTLGSQEFFGQSYIRNTFKSIDMPKSFRIQEGYEFSSVESLLKTLRTVSAARRKPDFAGIIIDSDQFGDRANEIIDQIANAGFSSQIVLVGVGNSSTWAKDLANAYAYSPFLFDQFPADLGSAKRDRTLVRGGQVFKKGKFKEAPVFGGMDRAPLADEEYPVPFDQLNLNDGKPKMLELGIKNSGFVVVKGIISARILSIRKSNGSSAVIELDSIKIPRTDLYGAGDKKFIQKLIRDKKGKITVSDKLSEDTFVIYSVKSSRRSESRVGWNEILKNIRSAKTIQDVIEWEKSLVEHPQTKIAKVNAGYEHGRKEVMARIKLQESDIVFLPVPWDIPYEGNLVPHLWKYSRKDGKVVLTPLAESISDPRPNSVNLSTASSGRGKVRPEAQAIPQPRIFSVDDFIKFVNESGLAQLIYQPKGPTQNHAVKSDQPIQSGVLNEDAKLSRDLLRFFDSKWAIGEAIDAGDEDVIYFQNSQPATSITGISDAQQSADYSPVIKLGPWFFIPISDLTPGLIPIQVQKVINQLKSVYDEDKHKIFFFTPERYVPPARLQDNALSTYAANLIAAMMNDQKDFKNAVAVDFGGGRGLISRIALRLGARAAVQIESNGIDNEIAEQYFQIEGWQKSADFLSTGYQISDQNFTQDAFQDWAKTSGLSEAAEIVTINIGPWEMYGNANQKALELTTSWPKVKRIYNGGYLLNQPGHRKALEDAQVFLQNAGFETSLVQHNQIVVINAYRKARSELRPNSVNLSTASSGPGKVRSEARTQPEDSKRLEQGTEIILKANQEMRVPFLNALVKFLRKNIDGTIDFRVYNDWPLGYFVPGSSIFTGTREYFITRNLGDAVLNNKQVYLSETEKGEIKIQLRSEARADSQSLKDAKDVIVQTIDWLLSIGYPQSEVLKRYREAVLKAREVPPYAYAWIGKEADGSVFLKSREVNELGQALSILKSSDAFVEMLAAVVVREAWGFHIAEIHEDKISQWLAQAPAIFKSKERAAIPATSGILNNPPLGIFFEKHGSKIQEIVENILAFEVFEAHREYEYLKWAEDKGHYHPNKVMSAIAANPVISLADERKGFFLYQSGGDIFKLLDHSWSFFSAQSLLSTPAQRNANLTLEANFYWTLHEIRAKRISMEVFDKSAGLAANAFEESSKILFPRVNKLVQEMLRSEARENSVDSSVISGKPEKVRAEWRDSSRAVMKVAENVTAKIVARGMEWLVPTLFADEMKREMSEEWRVNERDILVKLLNENGNAVLPASLLIEMKDHERQQYLKLLETALKPGGGSQTEIVFSGRDAATLSEIFSGYEQFQKNANLRQLVKTNSADENIIASRFKHKNIAAAFDAVDETNHLSLIPSFKLSQDEFMKLSSGEQLQYLIHLTQLELLASVALKNQLADKTTSRTQLLREFLTKAGIQFSEENGFLKPSVQSLIAADLTQLMQAYQLTAQAA